MSFFWKKNLLSLSAGLMTCCVFWIFAKFAVWWIFVPVFLLWLFLLFFLFRQLNKRNSEVNFLPLLFFTAISFLCLFLLLEVLLLKILTVLLLAGMIVFLFYHSPKEEKLSYLRKPVRRFFSILWVVDLFAFSAFLYATNLFFQGLPFWLVCVLISLVSTFVSANIWQLYFEKEIKSFSFWLIIMFFITWEIVWVLHFLPFGFLALGFLFTWVWYIINLMFRFHLSSKGIIWKKQIWFLFSNLILYFLFLLFFVRWI